MINEKMTLIFDGKCGFCTRFVRLINRLDRKSNINIQAWQSPNVLDAQGLSQDDVKSAAWFFEKGKRFRGAAAINRALWRATGCPLFWMVYIMPPFKQFEDFVYQWVARNRRMFRGTKPYCREETSQCIQ
jgi:predicted DCC family thiol-disulfide oxidoreductase YuxK